MFMVEVLMILRTVVVEAVHVPSNTHVDLANEARKETGQGLKSGNTDSIPAVKIYSGPKRGSHFRKTRSPLLSDSN